MGVKWVNASRDLSSWICFLSFVLIDVFHLMHLNAIKEMHQKSIRGCCLCDQGAAPMAHIYLDLIFISKKMQSLMGVCLNMCGSHGLKWDVLFCVFFFIKVSETMS